ncbi:hypothetical protein Q3G72_009223 [Acer saccharum]|nr:hypothetical protein Q3G72_009223 [Acer saccharum]
MITFIVAGLLHLELRHVLRIPQNCRLDNDIFVLDENFLTFRHGTDDDLPPSHQNRILRGGHVARNGRFPVGSVPYPRMYNDTADMETQIYQLEQEGKFDQAAPSQSFGGLSPPFPSQPVAASHQPSSSAAKRGPGLPGVSSMKSMQYPSSEISREVIKNARLVANPGCYPTSIQLPLVPLIKANLIEYRNIIIDAKSGVSGAGRGAKEANLYSEIAEGIYSFGVTKHRHALEIEQGLSDAAHSKVTVSFTPHLMPMILGMQSTIYVEMAPGVTIEDLYEQLKISYKDEEFVKLLEKGVVPRTHNVRGSNYCLMDDFPDRIPGRGNHYISY